MQGILYEEPSFFLFALVTVILGGGAAWQTGKAVASTWGNGVQLILYMMLLGCGVRFLHYALFHGTLLTLHFYIVDTIVLIAIGLAAFRYTRATQMTTQYRWIYERTGPLSWRERVSPADGAEKAA
jgi:hypothetical protein